MAVLVCTRPCVSVCGTRCTRCTPLSYLSLLYTASPLTCAPARPADGVAGTPGGADLQESVCPRMRIRTGMLQDRHARAGMEKIAIAKGTCEALHPMQSVSRANKKKGLCHFQAPTHVSEMLRQQQSQNSSAWEHQK